MSRFRMYLVGSVAVASLLVAPSVCLARKTTITFWHPWGGSIGKGMTDLGKAFEASHPDIAVKVQSAPGHEKNDKLMTSIAAGTAPDLCMAVGFQIPEWADANVMCALDTYIKKSKVKEEDFFPAAWTRNEYEGRMYGMTFCADPNFLMYYNKGMFRAAGLPDQAPGTIAELDAYNEKLTKRDAAGKISATGIAPWEGQAGAGNELRTWGWVFGGDFVDRQKRQITINSPRVVEALEWIVGYAKRFPVADVRKSWGGKGTDGALATGKLGMWAWGPWWVDQVKVSYPKFTDFGLGRMPYRYADSRGVEWMGGWSMAITANSKHKNEAWEFMRWMTATPEGTQKVYELTGFFPGLKASGAFRKLDDPRLALYVDVLKNARHTYFQIPVETAMSVELAKALDVAVSMKKSPRQALDEATAAAQKEWNRLMARKAKR